MANEINMSQKQSIATLHARGVSNRRISQLLGLDRGTVNRQVSLLKSQNRPEAPTGKTAEIELSCDAKPMTVEGVGRGETVKADEGQEERQHEGQRRAVVEEGTRERESGNVVAAFGVPTGKGSENDVIWEEEPGRATEPLSVSDHVSDPVAGFQNRPEAPTGKSSEKDMVSEQTAGSANRTS